MTSEQFADNFIMTNQNKLPDQKMYLLREKLKTLPESRQPTLQSVHLKDPIVTLLLSFFFGIFGVDRFYLGDVGLGVLKLISTFLVIGFIWAFIDIFLCYKKTKEINFNNLMLVS